MEKRYSELTARVDGLSHDLGDLSGRLKERLQSEVDEYEGVKKTLDTASRAIAELQERYNKAIEIINDLSERVAQLESNYDPTVIK